MLQHISDELRRAVWYFDVLKSSPQLSHNAMTWVVMVIQVSPFQKFKMEPSTTPVTSSLHHQSSPSSSAIPQHGCQPPHNPLDHLTPSPTGPTSNSSSAAAVNPSRNLSSPPGKWPENLAASSASAASSATPPAHHVSSRPGRDTHMRCNVPISSSTALPSGQNSNECMVIVNLTCSPILFGGQKTKLLAHENTSSPFHYSSFRLVHFSSFSIPPSLAAEM